MILKVWVEETEDNLIYLMKRESNSLLKDKLNSLLLIKTNKVTEIQELSTLLQRHRNTISKWLIKYKKGGLESLVSIKDRKSFKPAIIKGETLDKLIEKLSSPEGFNSYTEIQSWLKQECDLDVSYYTVHKTVRYKLKAKLKVPRPSNIKKDKDKELAFKKTFQIK